MSDAATSSVTMWGLGQSQFANAAQSAVFTRDGSVTYVVAKLHALPLDCVDQLVGLGLRGPDGGAQSNGAEHAPSAGHNTAGVLAGSSVKHFAGEGGSRAEPFD